MMQLNVYAHIQYLLYLTRINPRKKELEKLGAKSMIRAELSIEQFSFGDGDFQSTPSAP